MSKSNQTKIFVKRPTPSALEVAEFEGRLKNRAREEEIDGRLSEIYRDKKGRLINVRKMEKRARRLFVVRFFKWLSLITFLAIISYAAWFFLVPGQDAGVVVEINGPEQVVAGEEFSYSVKYRNTSKVVIRDLKLDIAYPGSFVYSESSISPANKNNYWTLPELQPNEERVLEIKGRLINQENSANIIYAKLSYTPVNFSSEFKKEASHSTTISSLGFRVEADYASAALVGTDNEIKFKISDFANPFLKNFRIDFELPTDFQVIKDAPVSGTSSTPLASLPIVLTKTADYWRAELSASSSVPAIISFPFKVNSLGSGRGEMTVRFSYEGEEGKQYTFFEKRASFDLIKNDLNLTLIMNGSKSDQAVVFGEMLNYSISYENKGQIALNDVSLGAIISGEALDWSSLKSDYPAKIKDGGILLWDQENIPSLSSIKPGQSGEINFSIRVKDFSENDLGQDLRLKSYAQFSLGGRGLGDVQNRSNEIVSLLNSDLSLTEAIRYFDDNNIPVGEGPLPPKVGEKTGLRVYWTVTNNLHELTDTKVTLNLPENISFENRQSTDVGNIIFDPINRQVTWEIGRLPLSVHTVKGEFNIALIPTEVDRNKILVISSGAMVSAIDNETRSAISQKGQPKTSKLEDDDIAGLTNSGRVE